MAKRVRKPKAPAGPTPEQVARTAERAARVAAGAAAAREYYGAGDTRNAHLHPMSVARISLEEIQKILLLEGVEGLDRAHVEWLMVQLQETVKAFGDYECPNCADLRCDVALAKDAAFQAEKALEGRVTFLEEELAATREHLDQAETEYGDLADWVLSEEEGSPAPNEALRIAARAMLEVFARSTYPTDPILQAMRKALE